MEGQNSAKFLNNFLDCEDLGLFFFSSDGDLQKGLWVIFMPFCAQV